METKLEKKYGLITAIAMVVGTVIGSGVFFKATKVFNETKGDMTKSLLTVGIVGLIMLICSYVFSTLANKFEHVNGLVDYTEALLGKRYAYGMGWFLTIFYYPVLTQTLAWVSANYTCTLFKIENNDGAKLAIAAFYLIAGYTVNTLSPKLAGKFQVSATAIKLVPLVIMAVVGTICGLINGTTISSFQAATVDAATGSGSLLPAVCAFAFAYEGWVITTTINAELKNSKKNLPVALLIGAVIVVAVYMTYFIGLASVMSPNEIISAGGDLPIVAFTNLFGNPVFGTIVFVFIVISCLGTMNGLMLGCCRGMYSIAVRNQGPARKIFVQVDKATNMPTNSAVFGLILCGIWLLQWQLVMFNVNGVIPACLQWEADEIVIVALYAAYIPLFIAMMIKLKGENIFKRFITPALAVISSGFMCYSAYLAYKANGMVWSFLIICVVVVACGFFFYKDSRNEQ